jgi:hypothetical protein
MSQNNKTYKGGYMFNNKTRSKYSKFQQNIAKKQYNNYTKSFTKSFTNKLKKRSRSRSRSNIVLV